MAKINKFLKYCKIGRNITSVDVNVNLVNFANIFLIFFCMLKEYLSRDVYNLIVKTFSFNDITEIRLRVGERLIVCVKNKKYYLKNDDGEFVIVNKNMLNNFITRASENSIYAYNDNIINGYITLPKGIRVGLTGTVVVENGKVVTIKDFQSANIRIPHIVRNCSLKVYDYIVGEQIKNTLIISPPGAGKTTFLRDLVFQMSEHNCTKNVLIADERNEIANSVNGEPTVILGGFCDIYTNCSKSFAFKNGIRSMCPDVIVTDEIDLDRDLSDLIEATNCGVSIIATIHAHDLKDLKRKKGFDKVIDEKIFTRFVLLSNEFGPGTLVGVYDENFNCLMLGE